MITNYKDIINGKRTVNLVNSDDLKLKELGLEPSYFVMEPVYINLHGNVFYNGNGHYNCNLTNDVSSILNIMNFNNYERYERVSDYLGHCTLRFIIYKNQIYFHDEISLKAWKKYSYIREEITKKYGLSTQYNELTLRDYQEKVLFKDGRYPTGIQFINFNITPREYLELIQSTIVYNSKPIVDYKKLDSYDMRNYMNKIANIVKNFKCSWEMEGIYSENALNFINSLRQTKLDIFMSLYDLANKTNDMKKLVYDLLVEFNIYHEFEPTAVNDGIFDTAVEYEEGHYWECMFRSKTNELLVQLIGFDKIETQLPKTITTTKANIYEEFYNLILLGYDIVQIPKLVFDEDKQKLRWVKPNDFVQTAIDRECEEELKLIKKYVPYDQRDKFLRD